MIVSLLRCAMLDWYTFLRVFNHAKRNSTTGRPTRSSRFWSNGVQAEARGWGAAIACREPADAGWLHQRAGGACQLDYRWMPVGLPIQVIRPVSLSPGLSPVANPQIRLTIIVDMIGFERDVGVGRAVEIDADRISKDLVAALDRIVWAFHV